MCKNCQKWLSHFINASICVAKTLSKERLGHKLLFQNRNWSKVVKTLKIFDNLVACSIDLKFCAIFRSAVVGMFSPYRHVGIIWSRRRHACRHNLSFKIEWNTRRKTVKAKVSRIIHAYIISLPSYIFNKALNNNYVIMWRFGSNDVSFF